MGEERTWPCHWVMFRKWMNPKTKNPKDGWMAWQTGGGTGGTNIEIKKGLKPCSKEQVEAFEAIESDEEDMYPEEDFDYEGDDAGRPDYCKICYRYKNLIPEEE